MCFKSDSDKHATINALHVAAERYAENAQWIRTNNSDNTRLAEQFERQETEARRIAVEIENSGDE